LREFVGNCFVDPAVAGCGFRSRRHLRIWSIRGEVFAKSANGKPAVLPSVGIVLHGPVIKDTESDAQGAFAVDGLPPGTYEIEANAPGLYAALTVEVGPGHLPRSKLKWMSQLSPAVST
jgi:hypothetical protein